MTFSITGRCVETGMFGVAISTSSISVGSRCPHARAGVGAVATQNITDPHLARLVLDEMEAGYSAQEAISRITKKLRVHRLPTTHRRGHGRHHRPFHRHAYTGHSYRPSGARLRCGGQSTVLCPCARSDDSRLQPRPNGTFGGPLTVRLGGRDCRRGRSRPRTFRSFDCVG